MKHSLLRRYYLENRISKLEQLINEKTVGRGGGDSTPYKVWQYLRDEGPKTRPEIGQHFNSGALKVLPDMERERCIIKNGNLYSYNPDYNWEDVGVLPRTAQQELMQDIRNSIGAPSMDDLMNSTNAPEDETPARRDQQRQERPPRAPRVREVKKNLFSRKIEEVRAAIDEGQDVNQRNDKGQTPLIYACNAKQDTSDIIKLLLANGANPNDEFRGIPCINMVIRSNNNEGLIALVLAGANWSGDDVGNIGRSIVSASNENTFSKILDKNFTTNIKAYLYNLSNIICIAWNKFKSDSITNKIISIAFNVTSNKVSILQLLDRIDDRGQADYYISVMNACYKNGWIPGIDIIRNYSNRDLCKKIFESLNLLREGKVKLYDPYGLYLSTVISIGEKYNWELGDISNVLTQEDMDSHNEEWQCRFIYHFAKYGHSSDLAKILKRIKLKQFTDYDFREIIDLIIDGNDYDLARALCKQMRPYLIREILGQHSYYIAKIAGGRNEYFINYIIGIDTSKELINRLIQICAEAGEHRNSLCVKALQDNGYSITNDAGDSTENDVKKRKLINKIVEFINDDRMSSDVRQAINNDPSILDNEDIQEALNDPKNEHSVTARQLKRQYDQWAATIEKPKYDM
jgi:ankyrin repeat protein